jgi:hypothetical protein
MVPPQAIFSNNASKLTQFYHITIRLTEGGHYMGSQHPSVSLTRDEQRYQRQLENFHRVFQGRKGLSGVPAGNGELITGVVSTRA